MAQLTKMVKDRLAVLSERHGRMEQILLLLFTGGLSLLQAAQAFEQMEQELPLEDNQETKNCTHIQ